MHQTYNCTSPMNDLLYISKTKIEDTFHTKMHVHPNLEILLFTDGIGKIITSNRQIKVRSGDMIIINPNSRHYEATPGLEFYAIGIAKTNIYTQDTFTKKIISIHLDGKHFYNVKNLYHLMYEEIKYPKQNSLELIDYIYKALYIYIKRSDLLISKNENCSESELVYNVKTIIDNYYYQNILLDELAHRLNDSKSNICHKFKAETNTSIINYKIKKQLKEAYHLLKVSDMSISEIGEMVGIHSSSYFTKKFKEHFGCLPNDLKKGKN